jgi:hypothetical protein
MHVFTDSTIALREAVTRPSKRLSSWELLNLAEKDKALRAELHRQRAEPKKQRDVKLCFVRLAKRANRHTDNDLVDSFPLAGVTGDSQTLIEMKTGAIASNLTSVEYDLVLIDADHGPELVIEELVSATFDVFRE